jgi:N-acetylglucosaminyldiphosphoundecaprenol N-acetyl-beta-D-mannosaminyltransferase
MDQTVTLLGRFLDGNQTHLVLTADSNAVICGSTDEGYRRMFESASLITPDSAGVVWALGRYGAPVPARVSGVDILENICELSAARGSKIAFVGAAPGVAQAAADQLSARFPGCQIVYVRDGFFKPHDDESVAFDIAASGAEILCVAMGMPRQELFILDTAAITKVKIGIGVGGSFDVHSGQVKRAPGIIQKLRLEWLWRTLLNPKKLAKVKNLPLFYWRVRKAT